ncbi:unnamed protein product [Alopecurus aequalis]
MAMAAVRIAARRLTGQQPQAILRSAVEGEQGLLNRGANARRFTSSEASTANGPKIGTEHPSVSGSAGDERLTTIARKKEEIYDLMAEVQLDKAIPRIIRMKDRRLLQRLTDHVHHRPSNTEWHRYRREHAVNFWSGGATTFLASLYVFDRLSSYFDRNTQVQGADSNSNPVSHV